MMQLLSDLHATLAMGLPSQLLYGAVVLHGIHVVTRVTIREHRQRPYWTTVANSNPISDCSTVGE
jgi:hypothetical protein